MTLYDKATNFIINNQIKYMNEKIEITNDLVLDAIKDNFKPPMMTEMSEDVVRELAQRFELDFDGFFLEIRNNGEYSTDKGIKYFYTKDVFNWIKHFYIRIGLAESK